MDAVRLRDGAFVVMKVFRQSQHPHELSISKYFSSPELAHDTRNHCVTILDSFEAPHDPDKVILVMPLLKRFYDPPFETVGELVDCLTQLFEVRSSFCILQLYVSTPIPQGLLFIHEHNVAHWYAFPRPVPDISD